MTCNYHKESLAKFPLPSCPDKENYVTPKEYNEAMKEYHDDWAVVQGAHKHWIRQEQVEDACCSADAARAQAKADRLQCKATEWVKKHVWVKSPDNKPPKSCG